MDEIRDLPLWILFIGTIVGTVALVYRTPRLRHLITGQTTMINGRVVRDPRSKYVSGY